MKTRILAATAVVALAGSAMGQVLSTGTTSNNGTGGIFLDLTPTGPGLNLTAFSTQFANAAGGATNVEVWTRPGSYVGFTTSNVGWTLSQTVSGVSGGSALNSPDHVLTSPIALPAGQTTAVYLVGLTGSAIRYFGTGTTSTSNYSNADLALFTNVSRTGSVAFGGTQFTPRAFVGTLTYEVIPAPASLALVGLGGLVAGRRRR
jgi:uncharacterized protein (TIGR03382 family)